MVTAVIVPFRRKPRPAAEVSDGRVLAIAIIVTIVLIGIEAPVLLWAWRNWPAPAHQNEASPVSGKDEAALNADMIAAFKAFQAAIDAQRVPMMPQLSHAPFMSLGRIGIPQLLPAPHKVPQRRHSVPRRQSYQPSDHNAEDETARLNRRQAQ